MAISEETKREIAQIRAQLQKQRENNLTDIEEHQKAIQTLKAQNEALKARWDALKADIPEPTVVIDKEL